MLYRPWHYAEKLAALREAMPEAALGADVMVGFPGETEALFAESYQFIVAQPLTYLHLFPFSARPGTAAWAR
jgi:threonylcarbamoyladenosine tRNA methylthiotransferase MtaB